MPSRFNLHEELVTILGTRNVYFQPPESIRMTYPCIVYHKNAPGVSYADDIKYLDRKRYDLVVISRDPDNDIAENIANYFNYCTIQSRYIAENLYHDTLELYY